MKSCGAYCDLDCVVFRAAAFHELTGKIPPLCFVCIRIELRFCRLQKVAPSVDYSISSSHHVSMLNFLYVLKYISFVYRNLQRRLINQLKIYHVEIIVPF